MTQTRSLKEKLTGLGLNPAEWAQTPLILLVEAVWADGAPTDEQRRLVADTAARSERSRGGELDGGISIPDTDGAWRPTSWDAGACQTEYDVYLQTALQYIDLANDYLACTGRGGDCSGLARRMEAAYATFLNAMSLYFSCRNG